MKKCGFIAVLGETNSGKSSLINKLVGQKVSIVSRKVQTTLSKILGIVIHNESQIILVDTPGFLKNKKSDNLEKITWDAFRESDAILFMIDASKKDFKNSIALLKKIDPQKKTSLVMNKIDLIHKPKLLEIAVSLDKTRNFENIFMISSVTGSGISKILDYLSKTIPEGEWIFDENEITDSSFEKYTSEITREHIYHRLHQEIPYKCMVKTEHYQNQADGSVKIVQNIYVKNDSHRKIILGSKGNKIKAIGQAARQELSRLLGKNVHLFLHVFVGDPSSVIHD
ncbi:MAG: GTPase Era [Holosporaceae bacterium]|nr:GTPase Era [Holosporaceae bacterium]